MATTGVKRKEAPPSNALVVTKKAKTGDSVTSGAIIAVDERTSSLQAPIMLLEGHQAEVNVVKFSPDGQSIAFTSQTRAGFSVCVMSAQGGDAQPLVSGEDPSWAPNSRTIVFTRRLGNKRVLSLLDVPTRRVKDTAQISGSRSQPSWAK